MTEHPSTIDDYVAGLPAEPRAVVAEVVAAVRRVLPGAEERIRYGMPAFLFAGERYGVHVAGWKHHVGLVDLVERIVVALAEQHSTEG